MQDIKHLNGEYFLAVLKVFENIGKSLSERFECYYGIDGKVVAKTNRGR